MGEGKKQKPSGSGAAEDSQPVSQAPAKAAEATRGKSSVKTNVQRTKRPLGDIDDIFAKAKPAAVQGDAASKEKGKEIIAKGTASKTEQMKQEEPSKKPKIEGSKHDIFGDEAQRERKRTDDGFRVFSEEELGLNKKGGYTDLCPFDCDCCF